MGLFEAIEKLITEHGSAAVLREHVTLLRSESGLLETKNKDLAAEAVHLRAENQTLDSQIQHLRHQNDELKTQLAQTKHPHAGYVCDHCGSSDLTRIGSKPNPTFGDVGIKDALFRCGECRRESAFLEKPTA